MLDMNPPLIQCSLGAHARFPRQLTAQGEPSGLSTTKFDITTPPVAPPVTINAYV
jgi:hypothetical protein